MGRETAAKLHNYLASLTVVSANKTTFIVYVHYDHLVFLHVSDTRGCWIQLASESEANVSTKHTYSSKQ